MADGPLVTVIVNCYNHARWLDQCLESVRGQTYPHVQLIVMDDCSTDGSADLIRAWMARTGTACTFVANPENRGLATTRNAGLAMAEGEFVSWVSTDDVWLPRKLEVQVAEMERAGPSVGVVYSDAERIDPDGNLLPGGMMDPRVMPPQGDVFDRLLHYNFVTSGATLVRRDCIWAVGGYDSGIPIEDWDLWLRLARRSPFAFSPFASARYREVPTSRIHSMSRSEWLESALLMYGKHIGYRAELDPFLRDRMAESAVRLCANRHPAARRYLWTALRAGPPDKTLLALAAALARALGRQASAAAARRRHILRRGRARVRAAFGTRPASSPRDR